MYCFVDGAYLRETLQAFTDTWFKEPTSEFYVGAISSGCEKTFYYDAPPPQKTGEPDQDYQTRIKQNDVYLDTLRVNEGWHVFEGVTKRKGNRAQQKEVDILIAVDMLTHTHRKNTDRIRFIAGDLDFRPLVEAVVRDGMYLDLWYDPRHTATELIHAADSKRPLDIFALHSLLKPEYRQRHPFPQESHSGSEMGPPNKVLQARGFNNAGEHIANLWGEGSNDLLYISSTVPVVGVHYAMLHIDSDYRERLTQAWDVKYGSLNWQSI